MGRQRDRFQGIQVDRKAFPLLLLDLGNPSGKAFPVSFLVGKDLEDHPDRMGIGKERKVELQEEVEGAEQSQTHRVGKDKIDLLHRTLSLFVPSQVFSFPAIGIDEEKF